MESYTIVRIKATDQRLTLVHQPILASGDVKSVRVEYDCNAQWDDYSLAGVFYTLKKPEEVYEVALKNGACVIPWEALQEDGVLFIGLRGINTAGQIKTAVPVRYRVEKGSPCGNAPAPDPTPDRYEQLLAYVNDRFDQMAGGVSYPNGDEVEY